MNKRANVGTHSLCADSKDRPENDAQGRGRGAKLESGPISPLPTVFHIILGTHLLSGRISSS